MFSDARLTRLVRPMPPTPTAATFNRSLGAVKPLPSTWRGTIAKPADVAATLVTNRRLEMWAMMTSPLVVQVLGSGFSVYSLQLADPDVPEGERAGVIALQRDVAAGG